MQKSKLLERFLFSSSHAVEERCVPQFNFLPQGEKKDNGSLGLRAKLLLCSPSRDRTQTGDGFQSMS